MRFKLHESLLEATFRDAYKINQHYKNHVLQPGEKFNPHDPKFPYMTKEEYLKEAELLSNQKAGNAKAWNTIYGCVIEQKWDKDFDDGEIYYKIVKIRNPSKFTKMTGYVDVVIYYYYTGDDTTEVISTFELSHTEKAYDKYKNLFIRKLPDNKTDDTGLVRTPKSIEKIKRFYSK